MKEPMKESVKENFDQLDQETKADYLHLYLVEGYTQEKLQKFHCMEELQTRARIYLQYINLKIRFSLRILYNHLNLLWCLIV